MKIIIDNVGFSFDIGCRLLRLRHEEFPKDMFKDITTGQFVFYSDRDTLEKNWNKIEPMKFRDIAQLPNLEQRRVAIVCLGLDRLIKEVKPELVHTETIRKTTMWVGEDGDIDFKEFDDTYSLYKVKGEYFTDVTDRWRVANDVYYISCKDTSTDREYLIWVDMNSINNTNGLEVPSAINSIAWTIQTNIPIGNIEKIVRQGDCILIKPKGEYKLLERPRHLTGIEYRELLVAES